MNLSLQQPGVLFVRVDAGEPQGPFWILGDSGHVSEGGGDERLGIRSRHAAYAARIPAAEPEYVVRIHRAVNGGGDRKSRGSFVDVGVAGVQKADVPAPVDIFSEPDPERAKVHGDAPGSVGDRILLKPLLSGEEASYFLRAVFGEPDAAGAVNVDGEREARDRGDVILGEHRTLDRC